MKNKLNTLPVLPLRNFVMFPGLLTSIQTNDPYIVKLLGDLHKFEGEFVTSLMIKEDEYFYQTGCLVSLEDIETGENGMSVLTLRGLSKFFIDECISSEPIIMVNGKTLTDYSENSKATKSACNELSKLLKRYIFLSHPKPQAMLQAVAFINDPDILTNFCTHYFFEDPYEKQDLLHILNIDKRLDLINRRMKTMITTKLQSTEQSYVF
ncbi:MAG: LON peptidase substrate-binding domain-containing protein [Candidatus Cloacimonetes bacterium]|nr:LON peptidase substrate-binding domain-containing protein [Candidatus Cloacimonadota bacterium]